MARAKAAFPGAARILRELATAPERLRVGLRPEGRAPMREGVELFAEDGTPVGRSDLGRVRAVGRMPRLRWAMSPAPIATIGTTLMGEVRGKRLPVTVADLPFHPTTYKR